MDMVVSIWPPPGVESVRVEQVQMVARSRHRDVEQAALLVDLLWCPGRHVRRYAAVNHVEHIHHIPFLALSGMDRREDEIVFVEVRIGGYIPHCVGWVERQLAQEPLARRVARGELLQLLQISRARVRRVVQALEVRLVPAPDHPELTLPVSGPATERTHQLAEQRPIRAGCGRHF